MTIELSVSAVRRALLDQCDGSDRGAGEAASVLLGRLFHEVFAELVGGAERANGFRVALAAGLDPAARTEALVHHAYSVLVAPRLMAQLGHLQETTPQLLTFWNAVGHACRFVVKLLDEVGRGRPELASDWNSIRALFRTEVPLSCELRGPHWSAPVKLVGVADVLIRHPQRNELCAVELKLGKSVPAADLGQAALYRLLVAQGAPNSSTSLGLLRFAPDLHELHVEATRIAEAEARLLDLVAKLAGVDTQPVATNGSAASSRQHAPASPPSGPSATSKQPANDSGNRAAAHDELGRQLLRAYREFGVNLQIVAEPQVGPRFLRFCVRLGQGASVKAVEGRTREIGLRLQLQSPPIVKTEAGMLVIDLTRPDPESVSFASVSDQLPALDALRGSAQLPIGVDLRRRLVFANLADPISPHLLAAGTTGSGKTEWIRMALAGLLRSNTPETLRLVLIDPKLTAFRQLERSPFLHCPLWEPGNQPASELLDELVEEMDRRYASFRAQGCDDLGSYLSKTGRPYPRIVCVCDEYFALIGQDRKERAAIERSLYLLGAKARASGIHLLLATQQPSRRVIQGALDTNVPCRVGLLTASEIESRMLLREPGAESLSGYGDLLFKGGGPIVRLQAPLLSEAERHDIFGGA